MSSERDEKQAVFDRVVAHLRKQGRRATGQVAGSLRYKYRGDGGTSCAAGCLIADEHYSTELEGKNIYNAVVRDALVKSGLPERVQWLVGRLQVLHDGTEVESWEKRFSELAGECGLTYTPPDAMTPLEMSR